MTSTGGPTQVRYNDTVSHRLSDSPCLSGEKPYVCDICGSRHTRKGELLLHVRCIHTHERPFQCAYCPKNFQRRDLLRKHERIHTDTRPYGCEFCGKTFTARDKMIGRI